MDKPKVILFNDLCRLCLENPGADDIFTKPDLTQDIFICTGVKITSQDNLPRKICLQCLEIVVRAKKLRILAKANETHLKSLFDNDEDETFIVQISETYQSQSVEKTMSRKSSTDSDRTVRLEIVENDSPGEKTKSKKRKKSDSSENVSAVKIPKEKVQNSKSEAKKISVRKDLFDSSGAVTSTQDAKSTEQSPRKEVTFKRIKAENDEGWEYMCDVCKKKFNAWKKFYLHQKTHNRHIVCPLDTCGKKFATKGDLEKHIRTHTGERPYQCEICDRSFAQRGTLRVHRETVHAQKDLYIV